MTPVANCKTAALLVEVAYINTANCETSVSLSVSVSQSVNQSISQSVSFYPGKEMKIGAGTAKPELEDKVQKPGKTSDDFIIDIGTNNSTSKRSSKHLLQKPSEERANSKIGQKAGGTKREKPQEDDLFFYSAITVTICMAIFHMGIVVLKFLMANGVMTYAEPSTKESTTCPIMWMIDLMVNWLTN